MSATTAYNDSWINPRLKIAALWTSILFVFAYVDLFSLYRDDVRADIQAGELGGFTIGQVFLLFTTLYIAVPSLMLVLTVLLPVRTVRLTNIIIATLYIPTMAASAVGEWGYYLLGSGIETALLLGVILCAWTWPRVPAEPASGAAAGARRPGVIVPVATPAERPEPTRG